MAVLALVLLAVWLLLVAGLPLSSSSAAPVPPASPAPGTTLGPTVVGTAAVGGRLHLCGGRPRWPETGHWLRLSRLTGLGPGACR
jgi:hypothetical protein